MEVHRSAASELETIRVLQEFLSGTDSSLTISQGHAENWMCVTLNRTAAMKELCRLLDQRERSRQEVAKLEAAAAELAFLQTKVSLLKLIRDQRLDPVNILGSFVSGLSASADDLVKATGELVEQIEKNWGLETNG